MASIFILFLILTPERVYSQGYHLQTLKTSGIGPSFPCDFHQKVQYVHSWGKERKRCYGLHQMSHHFRHLCCALSWRHRETEVWSLGIGAVRRKIDFISRLQINSHASWTCSECRHSTRILSQGGISFNLTQSPSTRNHGPYSTGRDSEVRISETGLSSRRIEGTYVEQTHISKLTAGSSYRPSKLDVLQRPSPV